MKRNKMPCIKIFKLFLGLLLPITMHAAFAGYVDFTNEDIYKNLIDNQSSANRVIDVDGISVNMTLASIQPPGAKMKWFKNDGIGIESDSYEEDEIEAQEILQISFSETLLLQDIFLTDLFYESGYLEMGSFMLDNGTEINFTADNPSHPNGQKTIGVNEEVNWIKFSAPGRVNGQNHEYSVGGLTLMADVPEPATWVLLCFGIIMVFAMGRKRSKRDLPL